jgi:molybdopterin-guanine dinucleotide biosynthesis protein A
MPGAAQTQEQRKLALQVTGALLAGGRSQRMGTDKSTLKLAGKPLVERVIARLRPQVHRILISSNEAPDRFAGYCLPVVPDAEAEREGPLAGLAAALHWARRETPDAAFVATVPVDAPFLPHDLVERLVAGIQDAHASCAIAASGGRQHPVFGLWRLDIAQAADAALREGVRAMHRFAAHQQCAVVEFEIERIGGVALDPFFNINTPEDLLQAEAILTHLAAGEIAAGETPRG